MAILTKLGVWIFKFIIQDFQNQNSYLWIITMTSSIYPFMKACQKWIWHTILSALIRSLFPFEICQLEVKSKLCEWFPFTESYPKSGNFHEVQKSLFDTPFHQIWLEILTDGLRWLILLFLSCVNMFCFIYRLITSQMSPNKINFILFVKIKVFTSWATLEIKIKAEELHWTLPNQRNH